MDCSCSENMEVNKMDFFKKIYFYLEQHIQMKTVALEVSPPSTESIVLSIAKIQGPGACSGMELV